MELFTYTIPIVSRKAYNNSPVVIAPIGDIQWTGKKGSTACDLLKRHIDRCLEKNAYFVGLGDYIDAFSPSNRQRIRAAALYETADQVIEDKALELVYELFDTFFRPTVGRWIGCVHGHHWVQLRSGDTTDTRLCELLKTRFLGTSAYIRLLFHKGELDKRGSEQYTVTLFIHHGIGGGMKSYAPLVKLENILPYWDADVFLIGHTSKSAATPINRVTPRWVGPGAPDLVHRKVYIVGCGGFNKGYVVGAKQGNIAMGGYVENRLLNPTMLGAPIVMIRPNIDYIHKGHNKYSRVWNPDISVEL